MSRETNVQEEAAATTSLLLTMMFKKVSINEWCVQYENSNNKKIFPS